MRVLLIDVNCKYSSTGKIVYDLYNKLRAEGHEAAIAYGRGKKICEEKIYKFGLDIETYVHALLARVTGYNGYFSYFSTRRLIRFIEEFQPDVIHIHELHAYFVNIEPLINYIRQKGIKTVCTLHCEYMYTGKCGHSHECEKWKTECTKCPHVHEYPASILLDQTTYMFRKKKSLFDEWKGLVIATPSQWLADRAKQSFLRNCMTKVVHNGINVDIFRPQNADALKKEYNIKPDEKVVLGLAPDILSEAKGGSYILQLAEKMKNQKVRFVLVGVTGKGVEYIDNVVFVGKIRNQQKLAQHYSMADVFVICSKRENFPTTCLEAQCCGTPIVGFDTGGSRETAVLTEKYFTDYGDVDALKESVESILYFSDENYRTLSQLAKDSFNITKMYDRYLEIYKIVTSDER